MGKQSHGHGHVPYPCLGVQKYAPGEIVAAPDSTGEMWPAVSPPRDPELLPASPRLPCRWALYQRGKVPTDTRALFLFGSGIQFLNGTYARPTVGCSGHSAA